MDSQNLRPSARGAGEFATTHWSLVLRVGDRNDRESEKALAELCERYWVPLYAYVRRRGYETHQAQDLTQEFCVRLLDKDVLAAASPERGRFQSYLLTAMQNFLANAWDREHAQKCGGERRRLSLDFAAGESRWSFEPVEALSPERVYQRQWALTLLDAVMTRLQDEFVRAGKARQFELLKGALTGERSGPGYAAIAAELEISEDAARQAAHRLRKRYRELLRQEVAQTVADPSEVDEQIPNLFTALGA